MSLSLSISKVLRALETRSRASFHSLPQCSPRTTGEREKAHANAAFMSSCGSMATGEAQRPMRGRGVSGVERRVMPRSTMNSGLEKGGDSCSSRWMASVMTIVEMTVCFCGV